MRVQYVIEGEASDGARFTVGPTFDNHDAAVDYAVEYARAVSGTDHVVVQNTPAATVVEANGPLYWERLRIAH